MQYLCPHDDSVLVKDDEGNLECPECGLSINKAFVIFLKGARNEKLEASPIACDDDSIIADYGVGSAVNAVH